MGDLCELQRKLRILRLSNSFNISAVVVSLITAFEFLHSWWQLNSCIEKSERKEGLMVEVLSLATMAYSLSTPTGNSRFILSCSRPRASLTALSCISFWLSCSSLSRSSEIKRMLNHKKVIQCWWCSDKLLKVYQFCWWTPPCFLWLLSLGKLNYLCW